MNNCRRFKKILLTSMAAILICIGVVVSVTSMHATAKSDTRGILRKTLANSLLKCYKSAYMLSEGVSKQAFEEKGAVVLMTDAGINEKLIYVPNNVANNLADSQVTCLEAFNGTRRGWFGGQKMPGLFELAGTTAAKTNLNSLGYFRQTEVGEGDGDLGKKGCFSLSYNVFNNSRSHRSTTNQLCFSLDNENKIKSNLSLGDGIIIENDGSSDSVITLSVLCDDLVMGCKITYGGKYLDSLIDQDLRATPGETWDTFIAKVQEKLPKGVNGVVDIHNADISFRDASVNVSPIQEDELYERKIVGGMAPVTRATRFFMDGQENTLFTKQEQYDLLDYYFETVLKGSYGVSVSDNECSTNKTTYTSGGGYAYYDQNQGLWCKVYTGDSDNSSLRFNVIADDMRYLEPVTLDELLRQISAWDFEATGTDPDDPGMTETPIPDDGGTQNNLAACLSGASSLGWIICPVSQFLGEAVQGMYQGIQNEYLTIDSEDISTSSNNGTTGTYNGWKQFRDLANIAFVIALVVVILSQVTGFGVSNYGIKKVLPSLIVIAVLVNLSFYLCQLAVDISNIVGSSIYTLLHDLNPGTSNGYGVGDALSGILATLGTIGTTMVVGQVAMTVGPVILIVLIPTLIMAVVGTLAFFLTLGFRQAGVIIAIILSPLAIICYALPNTKKYFSRWLSLFSGLLILYPLCGALMGGSYFASGVLLRANNDNFFFNVTAILIQIVPFFFIPSLLRSSLSAMGNIGERISRFGTRVGGLLSRGAMSTDLIQDAKRRAQMYSARRNIERIDAGRDFRSRLGMDGAARRRRQRLIQQYSAIDMEDLKAEHGGDGLYDESKRNQAVANIRQGEFESDLKGQMSILKDNGVANRQDLLEQEHAEALNTLRDNPEDRNARVRLLAAQRLLSKTDAGRQAVNNNLSAAELDTRSLSGAAQTNSQSALTFAARDMFDDIGSSLKKDYRGMHDHLQDLAAGDWAKLAENTIAPVYDENTGSLIGYSNDHYDYRGINKLSSSRLSNSDDNTRANYIQGMRKNIIKGDDRLKLEGVARDVLNNREKLDTNNEVAGDMHKILNVKYAAHSANGDLSKITSAQAVNAQDAELLANAGSAEYSRILDGLIRGEIGQDDRKGLAFVASNALRDHAGNMSVSDVRQLGQIIDEARKIRVSH